MFFKDETFQSLLFLCLHRYLAWLEVFLTNIELSHPGAKELLEKGGIAVARSLIPGALSAVDKTMEETFMKFAKSAGTIYIVYFHNWVIDANREHLS